MAKVANFSTIAVIFTLIVVLACMMTQTTAQSDSSAYVVYTDYHYDQVIPVDEFFDDTSLKSFVAITNSVTQFVRDYIQNSAETTSAVKHIQSYFISREAIRTAIRFDNFQAAQTFLTLMKQFEKDNMKMGQEAIKKHGLAIVRASYPVDTPESIPLHCINGVQDEGETFIDCGGPNCPQCYYNESCEVNTDCKTYLKCADPTPTPTPNPDDGEGEGDDDGDDNTTQQVTGKRCVPDPTQTHNASSMMSISSVLAMVTMIIATYMM